MSRRPCLLGHASETGIMPVRFDPMAYALYADCVGG